MNVKAWVAAAALLILAESPACGGGPAEPSPPEPPKCAANVPESPPEVTVTFVIEVCNAQMEQLGRRVGVTVTSLDAAGRIGTYVDPETGREQPGPDVYNTTTTPWSHHAKLEPGIVVIELEAVYLGKRDEILSCHIERHGLELRDTRDMRQLTVVGPGGRGAVTVHCRYAGG